MRLKLILVPVAILALGACRSGNLPTGDHISEPPPPTPTLNLGTYEAPPKMDTCKGPTVRVPADCPTMTAAVALAQVGARLTINVSPGTYTENIRTADRTEVNLIKDGIGEVILDGGSATAITVGESASLYLFGLTIKSRQTRDDYTSATVLADLSKLITIDNCRISTTSIALSANYTDGTIVTRSTIIGNGLVGTRGLELYHQNEPKWDDHGAHAYNVAFQDIGTAIYRCSGFEPKLSPSGTGDSNSYQGVNVRLDSIPNDPC